MQCLLGGPGARVLRKAPALTREKRKPPEEASASAPPSETLQTTGLLSFSGKARFRSHRNRKQLGRAVEITGLWTRWISKFGARCNKQNLISLRNSSSFEVRGN